MRTFHNADYRCSGAVAQDGRIEPGDMILEVNGTSFEDMTNDEAVQTLRAAAQRPGLVDDTAVNCFHLQISFTRLIQVTLAHIKIQLSFWNLTHT